MFTSKSPNISALNHAKCAHVGLVGHVQRFWQAEDLIRCWVLLWLEFRKENQKEKTVRDQEIPVPLL